ncbi:MAG: sulfatase [Chloroflexota bacterium]
MSSLNRRDFLKLALAAGSLPAVERMAHSLPAQAAYGLQTGAKPNIIIILFDALSAANLSLYGYPRRTTPNLERFAARATVYHNHHSAGNFTTPSTASLLTGVYPWNHRAFNLSGLVRPALRPNNLFAAIGDGYHRHVFTQNVYADMLLHQFNDQIEQHDPLDRFSLVSSSIYSRLTPNDAIYGMKSLDQFLFKREEAHASLFLSIFNDLSLQVRDRLQSAAWAKTYPGGLPRLANTDIYFAFEQLTDGLMQLVSGLPGPSFAYLHLMPPHAPYLPARRFLGAFADGWAPPEIKKHRLAAGLTQEKLNGQRQTYDEFIANLDDEFGRLLDHLQRSGLLDNSYVIFTSDHGELFERGVTGHSTPLLFEPVLRIPLIIAAPGQAERRDVHALTSNVDLLPTLAQLAGRPTPEWCEGRLLPGLGGEEDPQRSAFVIEAKANAAYGRLRKASTALLKGPLKLVHYQGYRYYRDEYELYDLSEDPQELNNRFDDHPAAGDLLDELNRAQQTADAPYQA